tara:strand:+ start:16470 stop:16784 length:315 start_codon:yes stop_codon:yes gene_type:complete
MNKKAQGISIRTIIIALLALIVLVVLIGIFVGKIGDFSEDTGDISDRFGAGKIESGTCLTSDVVGEAQSGTCASQCGEEAIPVSQSLTMPADKRCAPGLSCCVT